MNSAIAPHLPSGLRQSQKDRLLPRIGLAWRPFNDDKTAVRAGFGVYNTTLLGSIFFALTDSLQAATLVYQNSVTPTGLAYTWPQTSPGSGSPTPIYGTASFNTANKIDWKDPYSEQWNLSIDHEFQGDMGARISYIGMKTDDLVWSPNLNDMSYSSTTPAQQRPLTDRPFPNWGTVNAHNPGAQATYEALQLEANHRQTRQANDALIQQLYAAIRPSLSPDQQTKLFVKSKDRGFLAALDRSHGEVNSNQGFAGAGRPKD